jgi:hypothetical protein
MWGLWSETLISIISLVGVSGVWLVPVLGIGKLATTLQYPQELYLSMGTWIDSVLGPVVLRLSALIRILAHAL